MSDSYLLVCTVYISLFVQFFVCTVILSVQCRLYRWMPVVYSYVCTYSVQVNHLYSRPCVSLVNSFLVVQMSVRTVFCQYRHLFCRLYSRFLYRQTPVRLYALRTVQTSVCTVIRLYCHPFVLSSFCTVGCLYSRLSRVVVSVQSSFCTVFCLYSLHSVQFSTCTVILS